MPFTKGNKLGEKGRDVRYKNRREIIEALRKYTDKYELLKMMEFSTSTLEVILNTFIKRNKN